MTDVLTLAEIAPRMAMLIVACTHCERRGRYRLDTLIARHGAEAGGACHRQRSRVERRLKVVRVLVWRP
jgi:hypothetical protein